MAWRISTELVAQIVAEAAAAPAVEICGLLLGHGETVERVRPCRNVAADPATRFEIDPAALLAAHRTARVGGPRIVGCYHSHPGGNAEPSACDAREAAANGWLWLIVAAGTVRGWQAGPAGQRHGRFDEVDLIG